MEIDMLYKITNIEPLIARNPKFKDCKVEMIKFFNLKNIVDNLGVDTVYTNDNQPPLFIDQSSLSKICLLASAKFGVDFKYKEFYEGKGCLPTIESNLPDTQSYTVKSSADLERVVEQHKNYSTYGIAETQREEKQREIKKAKVDALEEKLEEGRRAKRAEFDKATNLNRDFVNNKVVSIDFEFKIKGNDHIVTEFGLAISNKGNIENHHYLIEENYKTKFNRSLQDKFEFGKTEIVSEKDILPIINKHVKDADFILFHEQREDYDILRKLGWDIEKNKDKPVIDTQLCYKRYFREPGSPPDGEKLINLLKAFKVDSKNLHNSGNDAHYTLKLLQKMSEIHKFLLQNKNDNKNKEKRNKIKPR